MKSDVKKKYTKKNKGAEKKKKNMHRKRGREHDFELLAALVGLRMEPQELLTFLKVSDHPVAIRIRRIHRATIEGFRPLKGVDL